MRSHLRTLKCALPSARSHVCVLESRECFFTFALLYSTWTGVSCRGTWKYYLDVVGFAARLNLSIVQWLFFISGTFFVDACPIKDIYVAKGMFGHRVIWLHLQ